MKSWLDNTGLHCVLRMLEGTSENPFEDAEGLLQFCTFLVFSGNLNVSNFESTSVRSTSHEAIEMLSGIGADVSLVDFSNTDYVTCCNNASNRFTEDYSTFLPPSVTDSNSTSTGPIAPDKAESDDLEAEIHNLIITGAGIQERDEFADFALNSRAAGAVAVMCKSEPLWEVVTKTRDLKLSSNQKWDFEDTKRMGALLRVYLNAELANSNSSAYVPATGRAKIARNGIHKLLSELSGKVGIDAGISSEIGIPVPQVSYALLVRSKGNPKKMIEEALKLREKAMEMHSWLEDWLQQLLDAVDEEEERSIIEKFKSDSDELQEAIGVYTAINPRSAIDVLLGDRWIPTPNKVKQMNSWRRHRSRLLLFSDITRSLNMDENESDAFSLLKQIGESNKS